MHAVVSATAVAHSGTVDSSLERLVHRREAHCRSTLRGFLYAAQKGPASTSLKPALHLDDVSPECTSGEMGRRSPAVIGVIVVSGAMPAYGVISYSTQLFPFSAQL